MSKPQILVVDDDLTMLSLCRSVIERQGWSVDCARNKQQAEEMVGERQFDLVVLDLNLPDGDGLDIGRRLQQQGVSFLLMTARSDPQERLTGFEIGAADYLVKPFHPNELIYRIKRALPQPAEARPSTPDNPDALYRLGPWQVDLDRHLLINIDGRREELTLGESKLLAMLIDARGRVVSRERILQAVARSEGEGHYRTVDVLVSRLRKKIEEDPRKPALIFTAFGMGYRLGG
ncbi:response regulator transcription factor [Desulfurivibrio alkaliphilus]|uniref:Two component transcriptional regulator, winged helix family n=1 Tax=Desulfurivibrio alkaliphilus (strain DSM 19089 / UNIQEM U267 / AHT2) TaxID=589865 RepID=D6Z436_DESAT|nr:response regulator transcription factor [Desulfurivibrio alkaliphilus]ADH86311.1 two component transcriptional regulator, winged helix family [Desulfurivibrio alkaliphilus AHT 2]